MINELLINLVNSVVGAGKRTARGNQAHSCPYCKHHKPKLEINFSENKKGFNPWHCWVCNKKGTRITSLFKQCKASPEKFEELFKLIGNEREFKTTVSKTTLKLPEEYKKFKDITSSNIEGRQALSYLKNRGITQDDIDKYNIGYCSSGRYAKMVIIPSYDGVGEMNYFTARSFEKDAYTKYRNPETSRDIIPFEMFINWDLPLVICEGPFDAIAIKRNAIPLLGKNIQSNLMKKIVTSTVRKIYIALDQDARKQALYFAEKFINEGKEVYLVELEGKDPSEMGFSHFTNLIQQTFPLTQYDLMEKKLQLI
jgi:DNA primase|tara:strand:+ start:14201 stop:15133 length:933 start_codon:yes stop_codon:yes gene_type:complete